MKYLMVNGSPRKDGSSSRLMSKALEVLSKSGDKVDAIELRDHSISPCLACETCHKTGKCAQNDEMTNKFLPLAEECDAYVFISPVYWWGITAQIKLFIDRLYALGHTAFSGKKLFVAIVGGAREDDIEYQIIKSQFDQIAKYLKMDFSGYLPFSTSTTPEALAKVPSWLGK